MIYCHSSVLKMNFVFFLLFIQIRETLMDCVLKNLNKKSEMFNGILLTESSNYPYAVVFKRKVKRDVILNSKLAEPFCSGSIVNQRWLLTAASCFVKFNFKSIEVLVGSYRNISFIKLQHFEIENIKIHPEFNADTFENNLALIRTTESIFIPIDRDKDFHWNDQMTIMDLYETILMTRIKILFNYLLNVKAMEFEKCKKVYLEIKNITLPTNSICYHPIFPIEFQDKFVGGPLVSIDEKTGKVFQKGILSFGIKENFVNNTNMTHEKIDYTKPIVYPEHARPW